jgi:hypothetical protein
MRGDNVHAPRKNHYPCCELSLAATSQLPVSQSMLEGVLVLVPWGTLSRTKHWQALSTVPMESKLHVPLHWAQEMHTRTCGSRSGCVSTLLFQVTTRISSPGTCSPYPPRNNAGRCVISRLILLMGDPYSGITDR